MSPSLSTSPSCRILTIASNEESARKVIYLVTNSGVGDDMASLIPWTITNKYYTADVHFLIDNVSESDSGGSKFPPVQEDEKIPAIIFAFAKDEPYRSLFLAHHENLSAYDAEVCIAVRLPSSEMPISSTSSGPEEDDESIDEFFADHGFEYVLADKNLTYSHDGVLGISRVRDALHSIMWPTLVRREGNTSGKAKRSSRLPVSLTDDIVGGESLSLAVDDLTEDIARSLFISPDDGMNDRDLKALESWLDADTDEPWRPSDSSAAVASSANAGVPTSTSSAPSGFEDDFTDFVSAPPSAPPSDFPSVSSLPSTSAAPSSSLLVAADKGADADWDPNSWLPTQAEIASASARIFRPSSTSPPPPHGDDDTLGTFDLAQVLSTLQAMKEEISGIVDEDERRRVAARAALGLVAGLGLDANVDEDDVSELGEELRVD